MQHLFIPVCFNGSKIGILEVRFVSYYAYLPWVIIYNAIPASWWQSYHARLILEMISKLQFWKIYLMYLNRQTLSPNTNLEGFLSPPMQVIVLGRLVYAFHGLRKIAYGYFIPQ